MKNKEYSAKHSTAKIASCAITGGASEKTIPAWNAVPMITAAFRKRGDQRANARNTSTKIEAAANAERTAGGGMNDFRMFAASINPERYCAFNFESAANKYTIDNCSLSN